MDSDQLFFDGEKIIILVKLIREIFMIRLFRLNSEKIFLPYKLVTKL